MSQLINVQNDRKFSIDLISEYDVFRIEEHENYPLWTPITVDGTVVNDGNIILN